jgi:GT2 family glycosyltransferase
MKNNVFIIIVNWNGKQYLDDCLSSLEDQTYKFFKTIIIDNNSSDDSVEFIKKKFIQIKIIQNTQNFGFAQGNNIGIKYALQNNADIIILLNNDTIVDKNWLQEMINTANSNKKIGLVQAKIFIDNKDKKHIINTVGNNIHYLGFGYCGHYKEIDNGQFSKDTEITYASGASLLIKKKVLDSIGMLDEKFFLYHEDLDLGWRARLFGFNIYLSNKAIVWHKYSFSKNKKKSII